MSNKQPGMTLFKRYRGDTKGNVGPMFAICSVFILGTIGAAMDISTLKSAQSHSQAIADATALTAAIFVKNNGRMPSAPQVNSNGEAEPEEGFQHMKLYTAAELGYDYKNWVAGGAENVTIQVSYDDNAKEATVTVRGRTNPSFIQVFDSFGPSDGRGHAKLSEGKKQERQAKRKNTMTFTAESVVSYYEIEDAFPASIALVLDNSGSMRWDDRPVDSDGNRPANAGSRISALKVSVETFREDMRARLGNQVAADGHRVLRTGILPYNDQIIAQTNGLAREMEWGYSGINDGHIASMGARGGTNSNPPMAEAMTWLATEDDDHRAEAERHNQGYRQPLKFVVFMTDGQNSVGSRYLVQDDDAPNAWTFWNGSWYQWTNSYPNWYWDYFGFEQGWLRRTADRDTVASCTAMKAQGTEIFTIAYGLDVGDYYDPYHDNPPPGDNYAYPYTQRVTAEVNNAAVSLMQQCASPGKFIMASNGTELEGAFDQIQNDIVKELIRIKS
jgi:hypothetical protein